MWQGVAVDASSGVSLAEQIAGGLRRRIDDRVLRPGMKLPPIRAMATQLGVSRFTVVEAYDRLVAGGLVSSRRGAGFFVEAGAHALPANANGADSVVERVIGRAFDNAEVMRESLVDDPQRVKVGAGWLPAGWLEEEPLRRRLRAVAGQSDARLVCYGSPQGYLPLRQQLQVRLDERGIAASPEQILLCSGATQALDLIARTLLRPGDCALVDDPGYWNLFASLRLLGVRLVGVPRRDDGPDLAALEEAIRVHQPKVFITHSVLHNPTSSSLSPAIAYRVLQLASAHGLTVVEDDTYADYQETAHSARLASLDGLQRVIYVGSFSKTLSANMRVGFLAADRETVRTLTDVKMFTAVSSSELAERVIYELLAEGHYRKFMARLRSRLGSAREAALRLLERCGYTVFHEPAGGMFLWAEPPGCDPEAAVGLAERAAEQLIVLAPGRLFRPQLESTRYLRFNAAYMADPRVIRFLERGSR